MKNIVMIPALLASATIAGHASALELGGANVAIVYTAQTDDFSDSHELISGSVELSFGGPVGVQIDVMNTSYQGFGSQGAFGFGGHLVYDISPSAAVGAYFISENWSGDIWNSYGVEAVIEAGKFTYEIAVGAVQEQGDSANFNINADAAYHVSEQFDITAGVLISYWDEIGNPNDHYNAYTVGGRYTFNSGLYLTGSYNMLSWSGGSDDSVSLGLGFDFGGGVTFSSRAYASLYPGE